MSRADDAKKIKQTLTMWEIMGAGAPTKYKKEYCETVIELMKMGRSINTVACMLDVHVDTLYEWAKVHPEFSESLKRAVKFSEMWWEEEGRTSLRDKDFNDRLWYRNMANRFGWRDKVDTNNNHTITHEDALKGLD